MEVAIERLRCGIRTNIECVIHPRRSFVPLRTFDEFIKFGNINGYPLAAQSVGAMHEWHCRSGVLVVAAKEN